ncbi:antitoxin component YwqK of YwqJK toxin-antitoxin module [Flavobacterium sp. 7E]|uniref:toxin-antitoxin system YwqK family antitoxin n=1 Tax=Flavobacterium sp. 7E TaxID=2735898 RepID=UPI001571552D|nr:hypothetical protein [Flavobacterium sp. 7E]NRS90365.1 antitoxin component YwqK of YwqJK toxin-antitoxin module [Flavobacterium sp. 7E]
MKTNNIKNNKVKLLLIILFYLFTTQNSNCQSKIYFDQDWKVTTKERASYYRIFSKRQDSLFQIKDFYSNGILQMEGCFSNLEKETLEGEIVWYDAKGAISSKANYKNGILHGLSTSYLKNGKIDYTTDYKEGEIYDGVYVGGAYKQFYKKGKLTKQIEVEAPNDFRNLETRVYGINKDTVYCG